VVVLQWEEATVAVEVSGAGVVAMGHQAIHHEEEGKSPSNVSHVNSIHHTNASHSYRGGFRGRARGYTPY
jgi:hypothetical protein